MSSRRASTHAQLPPTAARQPDTRDAAPARSGLRWRDDARWLDGDRARRAHRGCRSGIGAARRARETIVAARHHAAPRTHRGPLAPAASPVQRDTLERSGGARAAGLSGGAGRQPRARNVDGRRHHRARSRHRRRGLCRRGIQARDRRRRRPRSAHAGRRPRDGGTGKLRPKGICA